MAQKLPQIETAKIITISTEHLHPDTINFLDDTQGDMAEGPSIAVRNEGFLVNSHLSTEDALNRDCEPEFLPPLYDRFPDLVLIRPVRPGRSFTPCKAPWSILPGRATSTPRPLLLACDPTSRSTAGPG